ncbi:helix-turn-helix protein [Chitinophaga dinghuensis]|uniref:Helix-turn-helix protein n=1 Tax=Chitinophaga dinghuensis TaxID=1539050 RepID=A0A327VRF3_9BACT|nr:LexA family transcriptional regulator [Chitinophaga dinghuensis]RAJ76528.1 helix-turn-helix protein [Chitinophaga dinghuensis]
MDQSLFHWAGNLRFLRKRKNLTQQQLSDATGIKKGRLAAQESGKTKNPRMEDQVRISTYFNITIDHLIKTSLSDLTAEQLYEMETTSSLDITGRHIRVLPITVNTDNEENMEFVPVKAQAGYRRGFNDPEFIANLPKFTLPGLPREKTIRMFPVSGDSMLPIPDGSHVIAQYVDDWSLIKQDMPCVVILKEEDDILFKMVDNTMKHDGTLRLHSLNPAFKPFRVNANEVLEIWKFIGYVSREMPAIAS